MGMCENAASVVKKIERNINLKTKIKNIMKYQIYEYIELNSTIVG